MSKVENTVFWYGESYRGMMTSDGVLYPYIPLQTVNGKGETINLNPYPTKDRMLNEQPHLATYKQIDLNEDEDWARFFGVIK